MVEQADELTTGSSERVAGCGHDPAVRLALVDPDPRILGCDGGKAGPDRWFGRPVVDEHPLPVVVVLAEDGGDGVGERVQGWVVDRGDD